VNTPKIVISVSVFLLALSAVFGVLNTQKMHGLRAQVMQTEVARLASEQSQITREKELKAREATVVAVDTKLSETRTKAAGTEAELLQTQKEKDALRTKLRENETEIVQLLKRTEEAERASSAATSPSTSASADLQAQLEDLKKKLEIAEREKGVLSDKIRPAQERSAQLEPEKKKRLPAGGSAGIHGTVLVVNQAYNFVVLNLGSRQGVEPNTEMLVVRGGSFIGKIRISSVEPATAIGDIITSSLVRGVQVQPGDTVIYAGTNS
jgi:cell shape-determining protein MreC